MSVYHNSLKRVISLASQCSYAFKYSFGRELSNPLTPTLRFISQALIRLLDISTYPLGSKFNLPRKICLSLSDQHVSSSLNSEQPSQCFLLLANSCPTCWRVGKSHTFKSSIAPVNANDIRGAW